MRKRVKAQATRSQASRLRARSLSFSVHGIALVVACVVAAIAFGVPLERTNNKPVLQPLSSALDQIQLDLQLPEAASSSLLEPESESRGEDWQTVIIEPGDTLSRVFARLGLSSDDMYALLAAGSEARTLERLFPEQVLKLRIDPASQRLQELVFETDLISGIRIFRENGGFKISRYMHKIEKRTAFATGTVETTFLKAAREAGLPRELINGLQRLFQRQVNFSRDVKRGDHFTVLYQAHYFEGERIGFGKILAAELVIDGRTRQLIGFPDEQGKMHYFTAEGQSLEPAFIRFPVNYQRVSSPFAPNRLHPVLGVRRPHNGIDLAAPTGTPVRAAGDGVIESLGWQGGYGKTIVIDHGRGYKTLYAHLSSFESNLSTGTRVERGRVIGRVGRTGLATGPHLHYEVHVNGTPRNPATVELPGHPPLSGHRLARFQGHAEPLIAQIDLLRRTQVALNSIE